MWIVYGSSTQQRDLGWREKTGSESHHVDGTLRIKSPRVGEGVWRNDRRKPKTDRLL